MPSPEPSNEKLASAVRYYLSAALDTVVNLNDYGKIVDPPTLAANKWKQTKFAAGNLGRLAAAESKGITSIAEIELPVLLGMIKQIRGSESLTVRELKLGGIPGYQEARKLFADRVLENVVAKTISGNDSVAGLGEALKEALRGPVESD